MPNYSHSTKMALPVVEEPPYLTVGTDVSAKYKGAFCEAKIIDVNRHVKLRVLFKGSNNAYLIDDSNIKDGCEMKTGSLIEAKHPDKGNSFISATITKIIDHSRYTVIFDDGDQCILRRNSICLKSGKHFAESETLDQLPLTNPEHFGNPVKVGQTDTSASNSRSQSLSSTDNSPLRSTTTTSQHHPNDLKTPSSTKDNNNTKTNSKTLTAASNNQSDPPTVGKRGVSRGRKRRDSTKETPKISTSTTPMSVNNISDDNSSENDSECQPKNLKYELIEVGDKLKAKHNSNDLKTPSSTKDNTNFKTNSKTPIAASNNQSDTAAVGKRGVSRGRKRRDSTKETPKISTSITPMSTSNISDDNSSENDSECQDRNLKYELIDVGDKLKVKYGKGKLQKVYEAKVNKMETNSAGKTKYFVHYTGWNNRYDEWITRSRIIEIIKDDASKKKDKKKDEEDKKEREKEKERELERQKEIERQKQKEELERERKKEEELARQKQKKEEEEELERQRLKHEELEKQRREEEIEKAKQRQREEEELERQRLKHEELERQRRKEEEIEREKQRQREEDLKKERDTMQWSSLPDERIYMIQEKMATLRREYISIKSKLARLERKRRRTTVTDAN